MAEKRHRRMTRPLVEIDREMSVPRAGELDRPSATPGREVRSHFVRPGGEALPSDTAPCKAPEGTHWIWARSPELSLVPDPLVVGKWLIRVGCAQVAYCWGRVREATEEGTLGIGAKVSTDWGRTHDPAGFGPGRSGWDAHIICVYTADWRDPDDVARVGGRLGEIDAVRRQTLTYKPDAFTYAGMYSGNSPGEVAIFSMRPPYRELHEYAENLKNVAALIEEMRW